LPFNAAFDLVNTTVKSLGPGEAVPFAVAIYASPDSIIDTSDVRLGEVQVGPLAAGAEQQIVLDNLVLPQGLPWTGKIHIGMVIDPHGEVPETNEQNNANQAAAVDQAIVQLYDPIPPVSEITGFANLRVAERYLRGHGFHHVPPFTGSGWSKRLPRTADFVSRFDGVRRSGLAYRQNAFIRRPDATHSTYWILLQGTEAVAEPKPETALLYSLFDPGWFNYVRDWHRRF
jgi:hypothetical protein